MEKMPVAVGLWLGDIEVLASASTLFDAGVDRMLPTKDLAVTEARLRGCLLRDPDCELRLRTWTWFCHQLWFESLRARRLGFLRKVICASHLLPEADVHS
ncbi:MAG: hypothetical protein JSV94_02735 [Methanobacteriota archaeon]|nr:MAG: hypothetical protein JSV94_02735 [Euryarchaeota archaeon]